MTKINLQSQIKSLEIIRDREVFTEVTAEHIRKVIEEMKQYVLDRDFASCKDFIKHYIKEVTVYEKHVEVNLYMSFFKGQIVYESHSSIERSELK